MKTTLGSQPYFIQGDISEKKHLDSEKHVASEEKDVYGKIEELIGKEKKADLMQLSFVVNVMPLKEVKLVAKYTS